MHRPSHATVVAYLALFIALGGVSYAAVTLPRGSVGTAQIRKGAVTKSKLAAEVRNGLRGPAGRAGPKGDTGPIGPKGDTGPTGPAGLSNITTVRVTASVPPSQYGGEPAVCPAGSSVVGGGFNSANRLLTATTSRPIDNTWDARAYNTSAGALNLDTYAVCATVTP